MFTEIEFAFDGYGKYLGTQRKDGTWETAYRTLKAAHCNAKGFEVSTGENRRGLRGDSWPSVHITRARGPLAKDPYNEDGRPPTTMLVMYAAHVSICYGVVTIEGLEMPNLCWAGLLIPPYECNNCKPIRGAPHMTEEEYAEIRHLGRGYETLTRQRIMLYNPRRK